MWRKNKNVKIGPPMWCRPWRCPWGRSWRREAWYQTAGSLQHTPESIAVPDFTIFVYSSLFNSHDLKNRMNSSFSFKSSRCNLSYPSHRSSAKQLARQGSEQILSPKRSDDLCLSSLFILILWQQFIQFSLFWSYSFFCSFSVYFLAFHSAFGMPINRKSK